MRNKSLGLATVFAVAIMIVALVAEVQAIPRVIRVPEDYPTIQEAIDAASDWDTIMVEPGEWYGGIVDHPVKITGKPGAVIVDGEPYPGPGLPGPPQPYHFGFFITPEGSGSTISRFTFRCEYIGDTGTYLSLPIFARHGTDNVIISHNRIYVGDIPASQCITNWDGNNWVIKHNVIATHEFEGRFEGVVIASAAHFARGARDNVVASNTIMTDALTEGAIWLYVQVNITAGEVSNNVVAFNKVVAAGAEISAIILRVDYLGEGPTPDELLHDNLVVFNDLRGSTNPIAIDPPELEQVNMIWRNRR